MQYRKSSVQTMDPTCAQMTAVDFFRALRILFDILDDSKTGFIKLTDIETRWKNDTTADLPKDVLPCLRSVALPNGLLSFERFCSGIRSSLLRNQLHKNGRRWSCYDPPPPLPLPCRPALAGCCSMPQLPHPPYQSGPPKPPRVAAAAEYFMRKSSDQQMQVTDRQQCRIPKCNISGNWTGRRREIRRHTLHNGIDQSMLKKLKILDEERRMLVEGLKAVEKARDWYLTQLAALTNKSKYITHKEYDWGGGDMQQERIQLLRARINEVNRQLSMLTKGVAALPVHMNLALSNNNGNNNNYDREQKMRAESESWRRKPIIARDGIL